MTWDNLLNIHAFKQEAIKANAQTHTHMTNDERFCGVGAQLKLEMNV